MIKQLTALMGLAGLAAVFATGTAHAQDYQTDVIDQVRDDMTALGVNLPVFLAQRLPGMMGAAGGGAGSELSDDSGGVSVGVLARVGFLNNFKGVTHGLTLIDISEDTPDLLPWPQFGAVVGIGLGDGVEISADVQFIPETDIGGDDITLSASLLGVNAAFRWRVNHANGAVPAVILGVGGSIYNGTFQIGGKYRGTFDETVEGNRIEGDYSLSTAPKVEWTLFQVSPEVRLAWDIGGIIRPYVGISLGITGGNVTDEASVKSSITVNRVNGAAENETLTYEENVVLFETEPAVYTLRPHVGLDIVIGILAITAQVDLAIMGNSEIDANFSDAAGSFDTSDKGFLYSEAQGGSQTNAALVFSTALRLQL
jgi:hypothetical protein